jgi:hypothetical protein
MALDTKRRLQDCPLVIFIAYAVGPTAEEKGYSKWLRDVDMPFFNAIPGTLHYANWRLQSVNLGAPPVWDYFDFQGLVSEADLKRVWFNPDLDHFRSEWLRLWGYGNQKPPPVIAHSYAMRLVGSSPDHQTDDTLMLSGGTGPPPSADADLIYQVDGVLHKHFGGGATSEVWQTPASDNNPLGLDWLAVQYGSDRQPLKGASFAAQSTLIAAPDRD